MDWVFRCKVNKVLSHRSLDLAFDLGFSIKYRHDVTLNDYDVDDSLKEEAKNCLILLIGGHRVIVKVEKRDSVFVSKVYLYMPVKIPNCYDDVGDKRLQSVNKVMAEMSLKKFNTEYIKSVLPDMRLSDRTE